MAQMTGDGKKKFGNRMKANRYDRENAGKEPGPRAQLHEEEGMGQQDKMEEQVHPGIHDQVKQMAAEHGPAVGVQMTHDDVSGQHHVHSIHPDGFEHHSDHPTREHAHQHAMAAAGVESGEEQEEKEPKDEEEMESRTDDGDDDDYKPEPLD